MLVASQKYMVSQAQAFGLASRLDGRRDARPARVARGACAVRRVPSSRVPVSPRRASAVAAPVRRLSRQSFYISYVTCVHGVYDVLYA